MTKPGNDPKRSTESSSGQEGADRPTEAADDGQEQALAALDEMSTDAGGRAPAAGSEPQEPGEPPAEPEVGPLVILQQERDMFQEKWLRAAAELENVRKRSRREIQESRRFAQADVLRPLLQVLDNFERALQTPADQADNQASDGFREGVELIYQTFLGHLKDLGVETIAALDEPFDPNVHESVGQYEREGAASGQVIEVVQQGYRFADLVLRPTRVIIAG